MKRLLLVVAACSKGEPPPPPIPVTFDTFADARYDPVGDDDEHIYHFKRVVIEGYIGMRSGFVTCTSYGCLLPLFATPDLAGKSISLSVLPGDKPDHMRPLADGYTTKDFALLTHDQQPIGYGQRVRLTGDRDGDARHPESIVLRVKQIDQGLGTSPTDRARPTSDK